MSCFVCDRRNKVQHTSLLILLGMFLISVAVAMAKANDPSTGEVSLTEHAVVIIDILAYVLIAVFTALVGLVLYNVMDMKNTMRLMDGKIDSQGKDIRRELKWKVSIPQHNTICDRKLEVEGGEG